jgi:hypothetical protein
MAVGLLVSAVTLGSAAPADDGPAADALWQWMADRPNPALMDDFEVIEGITLVAAREGISEEAAAIATVMVFGLAPPALTEVPHSRCLEWASDAGGRALMDAFREQYGDSLTRAQQQRLHEFVARKCGAFVQRLTAAHEGSRQVTTGVRTPNLMHGLFVQSCLGEAEGIEGVLSLFREEALVAPTIQAQGPADFATLRSAVDRQVPAFLAGDEGFLVCVGYIAREDDRFLVLYDPSAGQTDVPTREGLTRQADGARGNPGAGRTGAAIGRLQLHSDPRLELSGKRPAGVTIREFVPGTWSATYIHTWRPALGTLVEEAEEYLQMP